MKQTSSPSNKAIQFKPLNSHEMYWNLTAITLPYFYARKKCAISDKKETKLAFLVSEN